MARERQGKDPKFAFLSGGPGANYYEWKISILQAKEALDSTQAAAKAAGGSSEDGIPLSRREALDAEERGRLLGEERLKGTSAGGIAEADKSRLQQQLLDNFRRCVLKHPLTNSISLVNN